MNVKTRLAMISATLLVGGALGAAQQYGEREQKPTGPAQLDVRSDPKWGSYVVDRKGMALYMFTADQPGETNCYDECARKWPPLLTEGDPQLASEELEESLLGTIERKDGSTQVTYGEWPLYYYYLDGEPGEVKGQDVHDSGGEWYLVSPEGKPIEEKKTE